MLVQESPREAKINSEVHSPIYTGNGSAYDSSVNRFFPLWVANAANYAPITIPDTDSALGRCHERAKKLGVKGLARFNVHFGNGFACAHLSPKPAIDKLSKNGVVDRTDVRVTTNTALVWSKARA